MPNHASCLLVLLLGCGVKKLAASSCPSQISPWSLLQIHSSKTNHNFSASANQACRGASPQDNSASYYSLHLGAESLAACKDLCASTSACKGIEYNAARGGRCEVWTRPGGISATSPMAGFVCLRFYWVFEPVDGPDRACRGASESDNSPAYYVTHGGAESLAECKGLCVGATLCHGIEYSKGRCEVWTLDEGIRATSPRNGFTCLKLRGVFEPIDPVASAGTTVSGPPATTVSTRTTPATTLTSTAAVINSMANVVKKGVSHVFSTVKAQSLTVVDLAGTAALICFCAEGQGYCSVLATAGDSLTQGPKVEVGDSGEILRLSVTRLSKSVALVCYVEHSHGSWGDPRPPSCRIFVRSGLSLTRGPSVVLDDDNELTMSLSIAGLSPTRALVCYDRLDAEGLTGVCSALLIGGTAIRHGQKYAFSAGDIDYGPEIVATRLSQSSALVCYRDDENFQSAACTAVVLEGTELVRDASLVLSDGHFHSLSATGMSSGDKAVVCFKDFALRPAQSVCAALAASGGALRKLDMTRVLTGKTSVARLSQTDALVCSSDTHHTHRAACAVLSLVDGQHLSKGPDLVLATDNTRDHYLAAGLSPQVSLVCCGSGTSANQHAGACATLLVSEMPASSVTWP